jgi:oligopeptidase B
MKNIGYLLLCCSTLFSCNNPQSKSMNTPEWPGLNAPVASVKPLQRILHGDTVTDNYYWMIDYFRKGPDSTAVLNYLREENEYTDTMMADTRALQDRLFKEMRARIKENDESVPVFRQGYYYYSRSDEGKQYFKYCRRKGSMDAPEEVLLDVDEMAEGHAYYSVKGFSISPDNNLLAYAVDTVSRREYVIHVRDIRTGATLPDAIPDTEADPAWAADNKTIFYTAKNKQTLLSESIKRHTLGTDPAADQIAYHEKDPSNYISVEKDKTGRYIIINSVATLSSEVRILEADRPDGNFRLVQPRVPDMLYEVIPHQDRFLIYTNWNALNFRLMECTTKNTERSYWNELVPHREDVLLEEVEVFSKYMVLSERENGLVNMRVMPHNGPEHYIRFDDPAYALRSGSNEEYNTDVIRYVYSSLTTPLSTYDYNMSAHKATLMKQQEVLGGYDRSDYVTERLQAKASDGTLVPISIVYKKGFQRNGKAPLLLYGYGSYGANIDPYFSSSMLSLLNRGFAYAIAHVRGGQEMGRKWYEAGKLMQKKNTFTDFIACAEYLVAEGYTSAQHLYAQGRSAGGLLMGAIVNMRPELWNGVIAEVPFVDVINTMLDESIPLTTNEFDEWGNPKQEAAYTYMKSYSPYENIAAAAYPNLLVLTGLHDSQVQYFEPAKWVARIRAMKQGKNVVLLKTEMEFGHGGASGRFDYLKETAFKYAFLLKLEGITK